MQFNLKIDIQDATIHFDENDKFSKITHLDTVLGQRISSFLYNDMKIVARVIVEVEDKSQISNDIS